MEQDAAPAGPASSAGHSGASGPRPTDTTIRVRGARWTLPAATSGPGHASAARGRNNAAVERREACASSQDARHASPGVDFGAAPLGAPPPSPTRRGTKRKVRARTRRGDAHGCPHRKRHHDRSAHDESSAEQFRSAGAHAAREREDRDAAGRGGPAPLLQLARILARLRRAAVPARARLRRRSDRVLHPPLEGLCGTRQGVGARRPGCARRRTVVAGGSTRGRHGARPLRHDDGEPAAPRARAATATNREGRVFASRG